MKNVWKKLTSLMLAVLMLIACTACAGTTEQGAASAGETAGGAATGGQTVAQDPSAETVSAKDTFVFVSPYTDPGNYNDYSNNSTQETIITYQIQETPFKIADDGSVECVLAESYEWVGEDVFRVKIRDGILFQNGTELTAEDVVFSCELRRNFAAGKAAFASIGEIELVDENTIDFHCTAMNDSIVTAIASTLITSKAYYEEVGDDGFALAPMGTGYYMWDEYVAGDHITLKAFDQYWGEHGTIKTLTIRFISELSQALIELENGLVDMVPANASTYISIEGNKDVTAWQYPSHLNEYLGFNWNSEKIKDERVRQAVAHAIDRNLIIAGACDGLAVPSYSMVSTSYTDYYNPATENAYPVDMEKAKQLMADAGYTPENPLALTLLTDTSTKRTLEAQQIKNALDQIGFDITINTFESASVSSIVVGGKAEDYDLVIRAVNLGSAYAPLYGFDKNLSVSATQSASNPCWLDIDSHELAADYDATTKAARAALEANDEKIDLYHHLQELNNEIIECIFLLVNNNSYAIGSNVRGLYTASFVGGSYLMLNQIYFVD